MAQIIYRTKIKFEGNKEFNFIGQHEPVNNTIEIPIDETFVGSYFPMRVNELPFTWSAVDVDGIVWSIEIQDNYTFVIDYGPRRVQGSLSNFSQLPIFIFPSINIYSSGLVTLKFYFRKLLYDGIPGGVGNVITGLCYNGESIDDDGDRLTYSQIIAAYKASGRQQIALMNVTEAGSTSVYFNKSITASTEHYPYFYDLGIGTETGFSDITPLNAISFEEYKPSNDISTGRLVLSPTTFYYDGQEHLPTATLYDKDDNILLYGTDWGISYSPDRTNPGQKIALAYGQGDYTGEITANWWILDDSDISGYTMNIVPNQMRYTGSEQTPLVTIYDRNGNLLTQNVDYTLELSSDRITIGQKYARATGIGDYTGTLEGTWAIFDSSIKPYMPGGETVPSTGPTDGAWDLPEDEIAPSGTIFSDLDAQLYRPYAMTAAQVASFSNQLWNTSILDVISRYFEKPTDVVIALMSYPFEVQSTETASQIAFNWISDWSSVYVTGHTITDELQTLDFGYIDIDRYSGTFYDYQPYSSVQLYLPYIGFVPLKMNEILGRRVYLKYIVDVITGDFSAIIETSWPDQSHEDETTIPVIATYQGNLAKALPLSQQDMFSIYKTGGEIAITGAIAATAGIGAFSAAAEAKEAAVTAKTYEEIGSNLASTMAEQRSSIAAQQSRTMLRTAKRAAAATGINAMYAVGHANSPIIRNGNLDGIAGRTSMQEAFVIISVPDQNIPGNQGILGYPTNLPGPLENYAGYTEVRDIRIKSATATESELAEIEEIVRGGIII